eukprot:6666420-Pyramimonas_sp.AAC.1
MTIDAGRDKALMTSKRSEELILHLLLQFRAPGGLLAMCKRLCLLSDRRPWVMGRQNDVQTIVLEFYRNFKCGIAKERNSAHRVAHGLPVLAGPTNCAFLSC